MRKRTVSLALVLGVFGAARAPGQGCAQERPLSAAEKAAVNGWVAALEKLLPAAPAGWKVFETKSHSSASGTVCEGPGPRAPFFATVTALYLPADAPEFARRSADQAREGAGKDMGALTQQLQSAVQRGDQKAMQEISQKIAAISRSSTMTTAPPTGRSPKRADVRLEVNDSGHELCAEAKPGGVPGAVFSSRWADVNCMLGVPTHGLAAGFGDFRPRTDSRDRVVGFLAGFTIDAGSRPMTKVYDTFVEMHGDAEGIGALSTSLDAAGLKGLVGR